MARDEGAGAGSILMAFILGAVSGAAVALLCAPGPGRDTREFLGEKAREGRERAAEVAEKGRKAVSEGREAMRQRERELRTEVEKRYEGTAGRPIA